MRLVITFLLLGLALGIGPCMASCGPLLLSYIAGTGKTVSRGLFTYLIFSISRMAAYAVLGVLIHLFGEIVTQRFAGLVGKYLYLAGGIFILFIGVLMMFRQEKKDGLCAKIQNVFLKKDAKTVGLWGIIIGLLPCAPLVSVLSYIGLVARSWPQSIFYSLAFGLGTMLSPLLLLCGAAGVLQKFLHDHLRVQRIFNGICGLVVVTLGAQLIRRAFINA